MKKIKMTQTKDAKEGIWNAVFCLDRSILFEIWSFEFWICFVLRASDFEFLSTCRVEILDGKRHEY